MHHLVGGGSLECRGRRHLMQAAVGLADHLVQLHERFDVEPSVVRYDLLACLKQLRLVLYLSQVDGLAQRVSEAVWLVLEQRRREGLCVEGTPEIPPCLLYHTS